MQLRPRQWNWEGPLARWATARLGAPHVFGETDCFTLLRDAAGVITGTPLDLSDVPAYYDPAMAVRASRAIVEKYGSIGGALVARGMVAIGSASRAVTGDVLIWEPATHLDVASAAIVVGREVLFAHEDRGVYSISLQQMMKDRDARVFRVR